MSEADATAAQKAEAQALLAAQHGELERYAGAVQARPPHLSHRPPWLPAKMLWLPAIMHCFLKYP